MWKCSKLVKRYKPWLLQIKKAEQTPHKINLEDPHQDTMKLLKTKDKNILKGREGSDVTCENWRVRMEVGTISRQELSS